MNSVCGCEIELSTTYSIHAALKKTTLLEPKAVITRVQQQKKKFWTVVAGLETIADLKIKDSSRIIHVRLLGERVTDRHAEFSLTNIFDCISKFRVMIV